MDKLEKESRKKSKDGGLGENCQNAVSRFLKKKPIQENEVVKNPEDRLSCAKIVAEQASLFSKGRKVESECRRVKKAKARAISKTDEPKKPNHAFEAICCYRNAMSRSFGVNDLPRASKRDFGMVKNFVNRYEDPKIVFQLIDYVMVNWDKLRLKCRISGSYPMMNVIFSKFGEQWMVEMNHGQKSNTFVKLKDEQEKRGIEEAKVKELSGTGDNW